MRVRDITPEWCEENLEGWEYNRRTKTGKAYCPCHDDVGSTMKGLAVSFANGTPLLKCHSEHCGATGTHVLRSRNGDGSDEVEVRVNGQKQPTIVYAYTDEFSNIEYLIGRYEPKAFRPVRLVNGSYVVVTFHGRPRPYKLPAVLAAVHEGHGVWFCDGEKDADRANVEGLVATCFAKAAGGWKREYRTYFYGAQITIVEDQDSGAGRAQTLALLNDLQGVAASIRVVRAREGKDLSDHFDAGHAADDFVEIEIDQYPTAGRRLQVRTFADITSKETFWLWEKRIPQSAVTLLAGMPGTGKTLLLCLIAAAVSRGDLGANKTVLFASAEDSPEHTLKPRLIAADADLTCVRHLFTTIKDEGGREIVSGSFALPSDVAPLAAAVEEHRPALLLIDPLMAHLDATINSWKDESARQAMTPLTAIAEEYECAVVCAMHLNKRREADPLIRLGGSLGGIAGPARAIFFFGESGDERLLVHTKHNLSAKQPTLVYSVDTCRVRLDDGATSDVGKVVLTGETDRGVEAIFEQEGEHTPIEDAVGFLEETLRDGSVPVKRIQADAKAEGISQTTLQRAKEKLQVQSHRKGFGAEGQWVWELPPKVTVLPKDRQAIGEGSIDGQS